MIGRPSLVVALGAITVAGVGVPPWAQNTPATQCTLTGKGAFDIGWVEVVKDQRFRCVSIFDPSLQRSGVGWVRVDADGRTQAP